MKYFNYVQFVFFAKICFKFTKVRHNSPEICKIHDAVLGVHNRDYRLKLKNSLLNHNYFDCVLKTQKLQYTVTNYTNWSKTKAYNT